ncbi:uncharacterized protein LOC119679813 isoform X1 [Teleopsis dalmanni]|uniref:uncharacterized protein LOC119679813 isoform X1 n=1 Tax=Teleopsis dalmanni TaxID=139649 RepID=UPI0018CECDAD|nr:uncharacterized protein LOC119679813 isoform X1 [Teleopsis dalmanni]
MKNSNCENVDKRHGCVQMKLIYNSTRTIRELLVKVGENCSDLQKHSCRKSKCNISTTILQHSKRYCEDMLIHYVSRLIQYYQLQLLNSGMN